MRTYAILLAAAAGAALTAPAFAATLYTDLSAWQAAAGNYLEDTDYGTPSTVPGYPPSAVLTLDGGPTLDFSQSSVWPVILQVGSQWSTWSGGYTGQVLFTNGAAALITNTTPTGGLGFFIESAEFAVVDFTLSLSDGSSISTSYDGNGGAGFIGFLGGDITSFTVSSSTSNNFAIGDFYIATAPAPTPEPISWVTMLAGFGLTGAAMRRRKTRLSFG